MGNLIKKLLKAKWYQRLSGFKNIKNVRFCLFSDKNKNVRLYCITIDLSKLIGKYKKLILSLDTNVIKLIQRRLNDEFKIHTNTR